MITAIGLGTDPTIRHFVNQCELKGVDVEFVDLHDLAMSDWLFPLPGENAIWRDGKAKRQLSATGRYYVRPIDISSVIASRRDALSWQSMVHALCAWLESSTNAVVINRPGHVQDNGSKPLHEALLARKGFLVPESVTSSDREELATFAITPSVVKTISGIRADCWVVEPGDFDAFKPESGPVHLQRRIEGYDVRAHVVGEAVYALRVDSDSADYRIDSNAEYGPISLPPALNELMISAAKEMGLIFSGWDFKIDHEGRFWLLEANPMPGYNSYDKRLNGIISEALIALLIGEQP